jgi:transposase
MRAYSTDLRQKIIDAYNSEGSFRNIAKRFCVSRSFVQKLVGRYRDTGLVSALPHGGGQKSKLNSLQIKVLRQIVIDNNDATLEELCELLSAEAQIKISRSTMDRLLQKLQLTRKKKTFHADEHAQRQSKKARGLQFLQSIRKFDLNNLVFVDESGVNIAMTLLYALSIER